MGHMQHPYILVGELGHTQGLVHNFEALALEVVVGVGVHILQQVDNPLLVLVDMVGHKVVLAVVSVVVLAVAVVVAWLHLRFPLHLLVLERQGRLGRQLVLVVGRLLVDFVEDGHLYHHHWRHVCLPQHHLVELGRLVLGRHQMNHPHQRLGLGRVLQLGRHHLRHLEHQLRHRRVRRENQLESQLVECQLFSYVLHDVSFDVYFYVYQVILRLRY